MSALKSAEFLGCAVVVGFAYALVRALEYFSGHIAWWPF